MRTNKLAPSVFVASSTRTWSSLWKAVVFCWCLFLFSFWSSVSVAFSRCYLQKYWRTAMYPDVLFSTSFSKEMQNDNNTSLKWQDTRNLFFFSFSFQKALKENRKSRSRDKHSKQSEIESTLGAIVLTLSCYWCLYSKMRSVRVLLPFSKK